jgi:hypothetical protein
MDKERAKQAVLRAKATLKGVLDEGHPVLISRKLSNHVAWKAMLVGLAQGDAIRACRHLRIKDIVCVAVPPQSLASTAYQPKAP